MKYTLKVGGFKMNSSRDGRWREKVDACRRTEGKIITKGDTRVWAKDLCSWCRATQCGGRIRTLCYTDLLLITPKKF